MADIILLAETGADIPPELASAHRIYTVPMHVNFGDDTRDDGTFPSEDVCGFYDRTGILPKTSGSMPEDFNRVLDMLHREYPESHILHLAYSAATTCSFQSARLAACDRPYVTSLDTKAASAGQGAVVLRTARLLEAHPEWEIEQAVAAAQNLICRVRMCFIPNELEYLRAGGRVSNATALCGKLLHIHPLIEFQDGQLIATKKLRGKMLNLAPRLVADYAAEHRLEREELWLIWTPGFPDEVRTAVEESAAACGIRQIHWVKSGGVITAHSGPGAFGMAGFAEVR